MPRIVEQVVLPGAALADQELLVYRWGQRGARPKAYVEGLDAGAARRLFELMAPLEAADDACQLVGEVVIVPETPRPAAALPALAEEVLPGLVGKLSGNALLNGSALQRRARQAVLERTPDSLEDAVGRAKLLLALDADAVIWVADAPSTIGHVGAAITQLWRVAAARLAPDTPLPTAPRMIHVQAANAAAEPLMRLLHELRVAQG